MKLHSLPLNKNHDSITTTLYFPDLPYIGGRKLKDIEISVRQISIAMHIHGKDKVVAYLLHLNSMIKAEDFTKTAKD